MVTIDVLVVRAQNILEDRRIFPDDDQLPVKLAAVVRQAHQLGQVQARHEHHDGAWEDGCELCDEERKSEGQILTRHGWDYPEP